MSSGLIGFPVMLVFLLCVILGGSASAYLVDEYPTKFAHPTKGNDTLSYEFDFTVTWESSMVYTDDEDVQWVSCGP